MPNKTQPFDLLKQELSGKNIIEASAGTGKTYSLAVLVLRLVLEKGIPIEQILLVTFTEAAAAELKDRTVKFLRMALQETETEGISGDSTIQQLVASCELNRTAKKTRIQKALLDIDKATMSTIHSFCQRTLNEFAFETGQVFGKELVPDVGDLINQAVNDFWRTYITTSDLNFWRSLGLLNKVILNQAVVERLNGKDFYDCGWANCHSLEEIEIKKSIYKAEIIKSFDASLLHLKSKTKGAGIKKLENGSTFYDYISTKEAFGFAELYPDEIKSVRKIENIKRHVAHYQLQKITTEILNKIRFKLQERNALTYNDIIDALYQKHGEKRLQELMQQKYKAVFVDEFQDTDPKQYAIFKSFFQDNEETILFFIGDPKQSIYGWRQADIATYQSAKNSPNMTCLEMNVNYRSTKEFIDAANQFFTDVPNSNLNYIRVEAKNRDDRGLHTIDNELFPALHIQKDVADIELNLSNTLKLILSGTYLLNGLPVTPSNIAVLVRNGFEGTNVKNIFQNLGIPSVLQMDANVFTSVEAEELKLLLKAVLHITKSNTNQVLLTKLVGLTLDELKKVDDDVVLPFFYELRSTLEKDGIFVMVKQFMQGFDLIEKWKNNTTFGHQKLANWQQLVNVLQEKTQKDNLTPSELLRFLIQAQKEDAKEVYAQGIESDEDAAKIMTIHKSKGLEFDIVLVPYLNLKETENTRFTFNSFRLNNRYFVSLSKLRNEAKIAHEQQNQDENERILYVALTRAKYNAFVFSKSNAFLLEPYLKNLQDAHNENIAFANQDEVDSWDAFDVHLPSEIDSTKIERNFPDLNFDDKYFKKLSYSFLAGSHQSHEKPNVQSYEDNSYEQFIFKDLPKGMHIGNLLHNIFEFIDFTDSTTWVEQIERSVRQFTPGKTQDNAFQQNLLRLVEHTVNAHLQLNGNQFQLCQIARKQRVNELEFNFPVNDFIDYSGLYHFFDEDESRTLRVAGSQVKGMMNGLIDMVFVNNGKFYILDWKSNFLGDSLTDYNRAGVELAMNESNYHLQYLIYALALEKYLKSKIPDFNFEHQFGGVIYLFLRGTRTNENSGVFTQTVSANEIRELERILGG
ncbi:MAG: exodeoxyribonuclease subunit beta [Bacteroidota bacterium]|jgi:exodeoxyribonuclease V beta subunit